MEKYFVVSNNALKNERKFCKCNCYLLKNRAIAPAHTNNTSTTMPTSIPRI